MVGAVVRVSSLEPPSRDPSDLAVKSIHSSYVQRTSRIETSETSETSVNEISEISDPHS